jgi:hypothetical protein
MVELNLASKLKVDNNLSVIEASHKILGERWLYCEEPTELLFTENETNKERLFGGSNTSPYVKMALMTTLSTVIKRL